MNSWFETGSPSTPNPIACVTGDPGPAYAAQPPAIRSTQAPVSGRNFPSETAAAAPACASTDSMRRAKSKFNKIGSMQRKVYNSACFLSFLHFSPFLPLCLSWDFLLSCILNKVFDEGAACLLRL